MANPTGVTRGGLYPSYEPTHKKGPRYFGWTGEFRKPRLGEWYLSGAIVEAYRALADLDTEYHIAVEVYVRQCPKCRGKGKVVTE